MSGFNRMLQCVKCVGRFFVRMLAEFHPDCVLDRPAHQAKNKRAKYINRGNIFGKNSQFLLKQIKINKLKLNLYS